MTTPSVNVAQKPLADERRSCRRQLSALHFKGVVFAVMRDEKAVVALVVLNVLDVLNDGDEDEGGGRD